MLWKEQPRLEAPIKAGQWVQQTGLSDLTGLASLNTPFGSERQLRNNGHGPSEEPSVIANEDPSPTQRQLHPLPRGLVELYGLLAVLFVLVPEWMADGALAVLPLRPAGQRLADDHHGLAKGS